jgi:hypothetical protein
MGTLTGPFGVHVNATDPLLDFIDSPAEIYGSGLDGSVVLTGTSNTLLEDKFYYNLTLADNATLDTAGYRLFVKNLLSVGSGVVIGRPGGSTAVGSINGGGAVDANVANSLGGAGAGGTVTAPTAASGGSKYYKHGPQAILGYQITASQTTPLFLNGGSGGTSGDGVGGGVVVIATRYVSVEPGGGAVISATGGANAGGGVIIFISTDTTMNPALTLNVSGAGTGADGTANYIEVD